MGKLFEENDEEEQEQERSPLDDIEDAKDDAVNLKNDIKDIKNKADKIKSKVDKAKEAGKQAGKEAGKETIKEAGKQAGKEAGKEVAKDAGKEVAKEAGKEIGKEVAKEGAKAGASAVAGSIVATPVGGAIIAVADLVINAKKKADEFKEKKKLTNVGKKQKEDNITKTPEQNKKEADKEEKAEKKRKKLFIVAFALIFILYFLFNYILVSSSTPSCVLAHWFVQYETRADGEKALKPTEKCEKLWEYVEGVIDGNEDYGFEVDEGDTDLKEGEHETKTSLDAMGEYDADCPLYGSYEQCYTICKKALKNAYKNAIAEAKEYCEENGYSWKKSKKTLKKTNSNSWKEVYEDANYGDLWSMLSLGYKKTDFEDFDILAWKELVMSDENSKFFYKIEYEMPDSDEESFDSEAYNEALEAYNAEVLANPYTTATCPKESDFYDNSSYLKITIHPFTVYSVYEMFDATPNDSYSDNLTLYDMQEQQVDHIIDVTDQWVSLKSTVNEGVDYCKEHGVVQGFTDIVGMLMHIHEKFEKYNESIDKYNLKEDTPLNYDFDNTDISKSTRASIAVEIGSVSGGTNQEIVWNYLKEAGFSDVGASAIMGNLEAEHHFSTSMSGDSGSVGLAQWLGSRKTALLNYASSSGYDVTDINVQASFLVNIDFPSRMNSKTVNGTSASTYVMNATNLQDACDIVCAYFESPSNYSSEADWLAHGGKFAWERYVYTSMTSRYYIDLGTRRAYAQKYYELYGTN